VTNPRDESPEDVLAEMLSEQHCVNAGLGNSVEQWIVDEWADRLAAALERERASQVDANTCHMIDVGPRPVILDASDDPDGCTITLQERGKPDTECNQPYEGN